jgi:threonine aldolase
MANQAALWLVAERGTEILLDAASHILDWEHAASAALIGVQTRPVHPLPGRLVIDADALAASIRPGGYATLVCLENTHNGAGGVVTSAAEMERLADVADAHGLPIHLDGARLWNAAVATGQSEATLAARARTVMVSFSKGLGAPIGAALAGPEAIMGRGHIVRRRLGGAMRQSGILAAAALHGIEHHHAGLVHDHRRAAALAAVVAGAGGARVVPPQTNIVMIDLPGPFAAEVAARTEREGVLVTEWSASRVRCVTHLDVGDAAVAHAAEVLAAALREAASEAGADL